MRVDPELEALVELCLGRMASDGQDAVEDVCIENPDKAAALRMVLRSLNQVGLIQDPSQEEVTGKHTPEQLGEFRILKRLGGGGMGEVYLAEQESLGRRVALKVIRPIYARSERARERFRREIELVSSLDHAGICPVFEAGEIEGTPYLAMRYLEGGTLGERIDRAREESGARRTTSNSHESIFELIAIVERVAKALHFAHERGLVHRDIKPGNIMITPEGEPVLLDFGLARLLADPSDLTTSGDHLGTPAYMSPEQVAGRDVGPRSDVYSLGATLFEALTLRCPHEAPTKELLYHAIVHGRPARASKINRSIPRDVEIVLEHCLDHDPQRRYSTALDLAEDLGRLRTRLPVRARRLPLVLRVRRWTQRNPVVSVALALLTIGLSTATLLLQQSNQSLRRAQALALLAGALDKVEEDQQLAMKLALAAVEHQPNLPQAISLLHRTLSHAHERWHRRHKHMFVCGTFSPDGAYVLGGTDNQQTNDGGVAVLYRTDGEFVQQFPRPEERATAGHRATVNGVAFSPDGHSIATASQDGTVKFWNSSGGLEQTFSRKLAVVDVEFLASDLLVAVEGNGKGYHGVGTDERIVLWQLGVPEPVKSVIIDAPATSLDVVGRQILTSHANGDVQLWSAMLEPIGEPFQHPQRVTSAVLGPQGKCIVTITVGGVVRVWSKSTRQVESHFNATLGLPMASVSISPSGDRIAVATGTWVARVYDLSGRVLSEFYGNGGWGGVEFAPDHSETVLLVGRGPISLFDVQIPTVPILRGHAAWIARADFDSAGKRIATASHDKTVRVWDAESGRELHELEHEAPAACVAFSSAGGAIATGTAHLGYGERDSYASLWAGDGGSLGGKISCKMGWWIMGFMHGSQGELLFLGAHDGVQLWQSGDNWRDRNMIAELKGKDLAGILTAVGLPAIRGALHHVAASPDQEHLLLLWASGELFEWSCRDPKEKRLLGKLPTWAWCADYSPTGNRIVTAGADGSVSVWRRDDFRTPLFSKKAHSGKAFDAHFHSSKPIVASAGEDGVRVWSVARGQLELLYELPGVGVRFSADGSRLVTYGANTAQVFVTDVHKLVRLARSRVCRDFTPTERERYGLPEGEENK